MQKYNRVGWEDAPSTATPLNAENLNKMDDGIEANNLAITALESEIAGKANQDDVESVKDDIDTVEEWVSNRLAEKASVADLNLLATTVNDKLSEKASQSDIETAVEDLYDDVKKDFQTKLVANESYGIALEKNSVNQLYPRLTDTMLTTINNKLDNSNLEAGTANLSVYSTQTSAVKSAICTYQKISNMCYAKILITMNAYTLNANSLLHFIDLPFAQNDTNTTLVLGVSSTGKQLRARITSKSTWFSITSNVLQSTTFAENEELNFFVAYKI